MLLANPRRGTGSGLPWLVVSEKQCSNTVSHSRPLRQSAEAEFANSVPGVKGTADLAAILYPPAPGAPTVWPTGVPRRASVDHPVRRRADRRPDDPAVAAPQRRRVPGP